MPQLTFVLPHWVYWAGLVVFPLLAIWLVRRQSAQTHATKLPIAYFLLISAGFVGLHRFYLKSLLGLVYIPVFLFILYGNVQVRDGLNVVSAARNEVTSQEFKLELAQEGVEKGKEGAGEKLAQSQEALAQARTALAASQDDIERWRSLGGYAAAGIFILLVIDALLIPRMVAALRRREDSEPGEGPGGWERPRDPELRDSVQSSATRFVDRINGFAGEFVAYWAVIAVFVYYYEVIARYVFNSPTNWAHESMFLMFGMQYLLCGGYALKEGAHVRVDVIYSLLPDKAKVFTDICTSVFFVIFTVALLWTGWTFFSDSMDVWEVSFTEWAIQYWPVKFAIPLGAALLLIQGLSHLYKDIVLYRQMGNG